MTTKNKDGPRIFVTVGSTKFTNLISAVLSTYVLDAVSEAVRSKYGEMEASIMIQFGATPIQDILLSEKLGVQDNDKSSGGTLPIRILSDDKAVPRPSPSEIAADLSPEAIRNQIVNGTGQDDQTQLGLKHFAMDWQASHGTIHLEFIDYVSSIGPYLKDADIVISHAGAGTILEALRMETTSRPKLILVPNETLMDNHQTELAKALSEQHFVYATRLFSKSKQEEEKVGKLPALLSSLLSGPLENSTDVIREFPAFVPGRFCAIVDEELGFSIR